jgi:hypothetical protein
MACVVIYLQPSTPFVKQEKIYDDQICVNPSIEFPWHISLRILKEPFGLCDLFIRHVFLQIKTKYKHMNSCIMLDFFCL